MTIRTLIVDDEAPARQRLRDLLARVPDVDVVQECRDGPTAVEAILEHHPDLVFLDVQMPEMSGLEVLEHVGVDKVPAVVFVTAYDQHAVEAFDARALDYLLKPFTEERFLESMRRVRLLLDARPARDHLSTMLADLIGQRTPRPERIPVRRGGRVRFVAVEEIDRIEGAGNYVRLFAGGVNHLVRGTLKSFAEMLASRGFVRVHHSHLVNLERVVEVEPWGHGEFVLRLRDGSEVTSSRTYRAEVRSFVEGPLSG